MLTQKVRDLTTISNQVDRHAGHRCPWKISFQQEETEIFESEEMKSPLVLRSLCFLLFKSFRFLGLSARMGGADGAAHGQASAPRPQG